MKIISSLFFLFFAVRAMTQSLELPSPVKNIYFHLYTDSLKVGVYNYINVDAELYDKRFWPLDTSYIYFSSNLGIWSGNSLILNQGISKDTAIRIRCILKADDRKKIDTILYIKRTQDNI